SAPVFFRCPESTAPPRRAGTSSPIAGGQHVSYASGRDERREQEREQEQHPVPRRRAEGGGARGEGFSDGDQQAQEVAEVKEDDAEIILPQRKSAPQHYGAATYPRSKHKSGRLECPRWKTKT
ncbi:unnamed protein product, partial [Prorocentrum cordatum]